MTSNQAVTTRKPEYAIHPVFVNRWSPRSFLQKPVPDEILMRLFEAARWAPSAFNHQPWRFIVLRSQEEKERFYPCISPNNLLWCKRAPVLVVIVSDTMRDGVPVRSHAFDTGAAWGFFALAATMEGLATHPMTGFDFEKARDILGIPDSYAIQVLVAVGYQGPVEDLPEQLRARERPNDRRPIGQSIYAGSFGVPLETSREDF